MIDDLDFDLSFNILNKLTDNTECEPSFNSSEFSEEFCGQHLVVTALKILHKAVTEGSSDQLSKLSLSRHKICDLNALLAENALVERVKERLNIEFDEKEAEQLQDFQIDLPQTTFEKMVEVATCIPRVVFSILLDLILLPVSGVLILISLVKEDFDPETPKTDTTPILLLHGSGFNQTEWILGRLFLEKEQYGSVFSLNYDGPTGADLEKGIDDCAKEKIRNKVLEIQKATGQNRVILIGHSMGGLVASYYAEYLALQDGITVEHVMSIGTPWKGTPFLQWLNEDTKPKRYKQMSIGSPFLQEVVNKALQSERTGQRKYYSIGSTTDLAVPAPSSNLTEDPRRQRCFSYLGHYGLVVSPRLWFQVRSWLDSIYATESLPAEAPYSDSLFNQQIEVEAGEGRSAVDCILDF